MLDYDIIFCAKSKLDENARKSFETRAKALLDQLQPLQIPMHWLSKEIYSNVGVQLNQNHDDENGYETANEYYTSNEFLANLLAKADIRVVKLNNGYNGALIASPSSQKDGLLFYIEAGLMLVDHSSLIEQTETEVYKYLDDLHKAPTHD